MRTQSILFLSALALSAAATAQYPLSSTLPRGETLLTATPQDHNLIGFGYWRTAAPSERLPAGPAGTVPTAQVAYVTYGEATASGVNLLFRRTTNGGLTWSAPTTLYTTQTGEAIDPAETRLVAAGHEVFVVFASNGHTLVAGQQAVFALGSADQGQTWTAPTLLSQQSLTVLRDVDEVNAVCSRLGSTTGPASLNVVYESDYNVPLSGVEDLYFVQAEVQGSNLVVTAPDQRINLAVAERTSDVNFTAIAADGPVIHIAWTDNRSGGGASQYDYFSLTSRQNGTDWATSTEYRHTTFPGPLTWAAPRRPRVAVDLPHVYTFMEHALNGQDDVWMDWSSDLGVTFAVTGIAINTATLGVAGDVDDMIVTASGGSVAVVYVDDRLNGVNDNDNNQAIVSVSHNGGTDFQNGTHVEVPLSLKDPNPIYDIQMSGDMIAVLYETNCVLLSASGAEDVTLSLSSDGGATFQDYDITSFGGCGQFPSGVDVDDPRLALTANGDAIVIWTDDRTVTGSGGGNTVNNTWVTGLHYPQLIDQTATFQGVTYQNDSPLAAGDLCFVVISATGTAAPITLGNLGFSMNLSFDAFTDASIAIALSSAPPNINQSLVGPTGDVQFPFFPNVTQLFGIPFYAAAFTITSAAQPGRFTDPIRFF